MQYTVMAFGMCSAPVALHLVALVLTKLPNCSTYLDYLVVYNPTWDKDMTSLRDVIHKLAKANLTPNLAKCEIGKITITYLGKQADQEKVKPVQETISAIVGYSIPTPGVSCGVS